MLKNDLHFSSSSHKRQMHAIIMRNIQLLWSFIDSIKDYIFSKDMLRIEPNKLLEYFYSVFVLFLVFRKNRECNCLFSYETSCEKFQNTSGYQMSKILADDGSFLRCASPLGRNSRRLPGQEKLNSGHGDQKGSS